MGDVLARVSPSFLRRARGLFIREGERETDVHSEMRGIFVAPATAYIYSTRGALLGKYDGARYGRYEFNAPGKTMPYLLDFSEL